MRIGYIYKITNTINGKSYIGQTTTNINTRWTQHKYISRKTSETTGLYGAIKKYGEEVFNIELIISCDESLLNEMEIYYIDKYNTYNNGYNRTLGGSGVSTLALDPDKVLKVYKQLGNMQKVAEHFSCSSSTIWIILNNYAPRELIAANKQRGSCVKGKNTQPVRIIELDLSFDSMLQCGEWLLENQYTKARDA